MKSANIPLKEIFNEIPQEKREETRLSFEISNKLDALMKEKGLNRKQLAEAVGKRSTLAMLSNFFGKDIISV